MDAHEAALAEGDEIDFTFFARNPRREFRARRALPRENDGREDLGWLLVRKSIEGSEMVLRKHSVAFERGPPDNDSFLFAAWFKVEESFRAGRHDFQLALLPSENRLFLALQGGRQ